MDRIHTAGRILHGDHQPFLSGELLNVLGKKLPDLRLGCLSFGRPRRGGDCETNKDEEQCFHGHSSPFSADQSQLLQSMRYINSDRVQGSFVTDFFEKKNRLRRDEMYTDQTATVWRMPVTPVRSRRGCSSA